jgi:hypothetical protein
MQSSVLLDIIVNQEQLLPNLLMVTLVSSAQLETTVHKELR